MHSGLGLRYPAFTWNNFDAFEKKITSLDPAVACQANLLHLSPEGLLPNIIIDRLEILLDIDPAVFSYLVSRGIQGQRGRGGEEFGLVQWVSRQNFIELGKGSVLVLEAIEGRRHKTGEFL